MHKGLLEWMATRERYAKQAEAYVALKDMNLKVVCYIAVKGIVDVLSHRRPLSSAAIRIGALVEDEARFSQFSQHDDYDMILKGAMKRPNYQKRRYYLAHSQKGEVSKGEAEEWKRWGTRLKMQIGTILIMLLQEHTGLVEFVKILKGNKRGPTRYIQATKKTEEWITGMIKHNSMLDPFWMPLKSFPKQWDNKWSGGYDDEDGLPPLPIIKLRNKAYLRQIEEPMTEVMGCLNHLQNTAFEVNPHVFNLLQNLWERDVPVGDLPQQSDEPLPPVPPNMVDDPIVKRDWKRSAAAIYDYNASTKSRRILVLNTIGLAKRYLGEAFYLPHQCDFRGRAYAVPSYLNHMGPDFAKGLVRFVKTERIQTEGDTAWLYIHGANTFGIKGTYDDRIRWVDQNKKSILALAEASSPDLDFLREADEPFQFAAFADEFARMHSTWDNGFDTKLPCQMDASNNGLQILGMLMRDPSSCEATNVAANDSPQDIYQRVMDVAIEEIRLEIDSHPFAKLWLSFGLDRGCAKRPTMTQPYGSTRHSCRQYVHQWYLERTRGGTSDPFDPSNRFEACSYLAMKVWHAIESVVGRPRQAMDWLQKTARVLSSHNLPMEWKTPSGFPVMQAYEKYAEKSIRTKVGDKIFRVKFREDMGKLSPRRQAQGSSPNFVHSLDASILHKTVNDCAEKGISSFAMVHDSYGTHAPKCPIMADSIRSNVYDVFSVDQLQALRVVLMDTHDIELPELPSYGGFDISEVLESLYMFS
jgi:DNA-directed RNA polymerase